MRYALIFNNLIENIVEWDGASPSALPPGRIMASAQDIFVSIGWIWNNGSPLNPNPLPPLDPAVDFSNADNQAKALKAVLLAAGAMAGKTPAQSKAAFTAAWQALP